MLKEQQQALLCSMYHQNMSQQSAMYCLLRPLLLPPTVRKPGNDGSTSCAAWCTSQAGGTQYSSCQSAYDTKAKTAISCTQLLGYFKTYPPQCYCQGLVWQGVWNGTVTRKTPTTTTTTTKVSNCTLLHRACVTCAYQRIPGTKNTDFICSTCASGWRLRNDGIYKTCGEQGVKLVQVPAMLSMHQSSSTWGLSIQIVFTNTTAAGRMGATPFIPGISTNSSCAQASLLHTSVSLSLSALACVLLLQTVCLA
jgi:hypothetical protein